MRTRICIASFPAVVNYLGRYIYRIAITNGRILEVGEKKVSFTCKNYAAQIAPDKPVPEEVKELEGEEFLRRFSQHILVPYFQRVRYYGFYAAAARSSLDEARERIGNRDWCYTVRTVVQIISAMIGMDPDVCECCGSRGQWKVEVILSYWEAHRQRKGLPRAKPPPNHGKILHFVPFGAP